MRECDVNLLLEAKNPIILDAFMKAESVLSEHHMACVSISGGADSDIMLDLFERVRMNQSCKIQYVFFDTGFEYRATKEHIAHLEEKYGIEIERRKSEKSIPTCVREYGQPFISKFVSTQIERLQRHGFHFEDEPLEVLIERYPDATSAIKWWSNAYRGGKSTFDINRNAMLREFLVSHPPSFRISSKCCKFAKKEVSRKFVAESGGDLICVGVRKAEGGVRSKNPSMTCFSRGGGWRKYVSTIVLVFKRRLQ